MFVKFTSIDRLNAWLQYHDNLILTDEFQVINHNKKINYIVRFRLKDHIILKDNSKRYSFKELLHIVLHDAKVFNSFTEKELKQYLQ